MEKFIKSIYASVKVSQCPRCKLSVRQTIFDYSKEIYKCTKCGNIHA